MTGELDAFSLENRNLEIFDSRDILSSWRAVGSLAEIICILDNPGKEWTNNINRHCRICLIRAQL